tara:strand:- start:113 stop:514 length:402 start_codon:yes stop_codon:yes gene_type:complete
MIIVSIIFFSIGVFFWSLGAWPVFGFLGLDVLLLYLAFKINYKKGEIFENLKLFKSNLVITRVFPSGKAQKWSLEPYWTKVDLLNTSPNEYKLVLKSKEKVVLLGAFLNLNDKKKLMKRINDALLTYKTAAKA